MTSPLIRRALDRFVGIDSRRKLPLFAAQTFESWFAKRAVPAVGNGHAGSAGKVVLFHDTFINYNYPEIGKAATQLLEDAIGAAGMIPDPGSEPAAHIAATGHG